jgi:hypothetical protein
MSAPFLVGFSGKPGSAKNHFSFKLMQELRFQGYTVHKGSLAASLYEDVNTLIDGVQRGRDDVLTDVNIPDEHVEAVLELAGGDVGERNPEWGYSRRNESVRKLLALLGGTIRQQQDPLYLLHEMVGRAPDKDFILFSDLRYPAEADYTSEHGAAVRCEVNEHWVASTTEGQADGYKYSAAGLQDPTETALDDWDGWFIRLMYNRNRPILFSHSLMRAHGFKVRKHEFFQVQPQ